MFNQKSNIKLWIILAVLIIAVAIIFSTDSTKKERSFRKDLVSIDTANVSEISLFPKSQKGKEVKLVKKDNIWKVTSENGKQFTVPKTKINNLFNQLLAIVPKRIAARSKDKWKEYQIDSASTIVVVNQGSEKVLDLMIGKFAFQQPRSMSTFVKLAKDNDVYEVDGFLDMTFNKDVNSFRNETVIKSDKDKWNKLKFEMENPDSSFELVKMDKQWFINGQKTDSAKTEQTLNSLSRLTNSNFSNIEKAAFPKQTNRLTIETGEQPIIITAYQDSTNYIIESSMNEENYFDGKSIGNKIFISIKSLLND
ncbi:MAG: DUF4340 domain-containing protein [Ignavibacteriales bacterium]|nr:DUF4340 domain-containing protein [Ignavibacteriales bacterium]